MWRVERDLSQPASVNLEQNFAFPTIYCVKDGIHWLVTFIGYRRFTNIYTYKRSLRA